MKREDPLIIRLHFQPALYELVRLVGYEGVPETVLCETIKPLVAAHSLAKMRPAASELTQTDEKTRLVTLRPNVRKIAFQILGPPPERTDYESYWASQGVLPPNKRPKEEPVTPPEDKPPDKAKKPKRTKKVK